MPPQFLTDWMVVVEWLVVVGTFAAVIVALFAAKIEQAWHGHPKLAVIADKNLVLPPNEEDNAFALLRIENKGTYYADRAEVFIKSVSREVSPGTYNPEPYFVSMSLRWYESEPGRWDIFTTIAPRLHRTCTLGALRREDRQDSLSSNTDAVYFELWTAFKRTAKANELRSGNYQIELILIAEGMKPQSHDILLTVPTTFNYEHLIVKLLQNH